MRRILLMLCICVFLLPASASFAEEDLLVNGSFEESTDGWPDGWDKDMWLYDQGVSYLELREEGRDGGWCALVENVSSNDARFVQTVSIEPNTVYRFSGWVKAQGCDTSKGGATLSVISSYVSFPDVHDTDGEWVYLESYFRTAETQNSLTVGARLGNYSADNVGKAWFDDLSLTRLDAAPAGASVEQLIDYSNYDAGQSQTATESTSNDGLNILLWLAVFAAALAALWAFRQRGVSCPRVMIWLLLALAAILRLYLMATQPGYNVDMNCFYAWSIRMTETGPSGFYSSDIFCDYPPGYMYLLWITGYLLKAFGAQGLDMTGRIIVKLMPMLADLGTIYLLYRLGRKRLGETPAILLAALYAISPAILVDGAVWGQVDAFIALGLLLSVVFVAEGNWKAALPVYVVTVLMKPQALMAGPLGLLALIMAWRKEGRKIGIDALKGLGISLLVAAAVLLPFLWGEANPISWLFDKYISTLSYYHYATVSTANLYYLMGANWVPLDEIAFGGITYGTLGWILMAVVIVGVLLLYLRKNDVAELPFFGALLFIGLFVFGTQMHERYLFPAFALLLYAYIRKRDWRLLAMFAGFSATFFVNCAIVLRDTHMALGRGTVGCVLAVVNILVCALGVWVAVDKKTRPLPEWKPAERKAADRLPLLTGRSEPFPHMGKKDWAGMLGLTLTYALIAFVGLGSTVAPQTEWMSTGASEQVVFDLGEESEFEILYYGGVNRRDHTFTLEFSADGETWTDKAPVQVTQGDCFSWKYVGQAYYDEWGDVTGWGNEPVTYGARYVRLTADGPSLTLMEIVFRTPGGEPIAVQSAVSTGSRDGSAYGPMLLVDESDTVPENPSYYNSTYFDEIYHARTGYEHANGLSTYETTHPPLGKVFIMWGIKLFGMTAFGWRFMGALMGVLMVPAMYLLGKLLFKKSRYAFLAAFVMAFDMMHLTQTRIATIDSYAVLFIILMYLCMFRYMQMSFFRDGWRTLIPLGISGLFMGLGCASKWIGFYAAAGLAILFAWTMVQRFLEWRAGMDAGGVHAERVRNYPVYLLGTLGFCLLFFIAIPFAIYYFSYIPYFTWDGGLTWERFWNAQKGMYSYHSGLVDTHAFKSPWYEWPLSLKPMYYYNGKPFVDEGNISTIMCMGNPAVWWVGFAAFLYVFWCWLRPHLRGERPKDHMPAMLLLAFAAQYVPWMLVPRSTFIYHYFGSLPFVMLCIVYAFKHFHEAKPNAARTVQYIYMGVVLLLFIGFYPIGTGAQVSETWANCMNWLSFLRLPGWQFKGWLYY